jgi:hypothetical protein
MAKHPVYRLIGLRKVPDDIRRQLEQENILFDEEGTCCALDFRHFRSKRLLASRKFSFGSIGSLVITEKSIFISFPYMISCHRPIEEAIPCIFPGFADGKLIISFNVSQLFDHASGKLTCYWRTENAEAIYEHLRALRNS